MPVPAWYNVHSTASAAKGPRPGAQALGAPMAPPGIGRTADGMMNVYYRGNTAGTCSLSRDSGAAAAASQEEDIQ